MSKLKDIPSGTVPLPKDPVLSKCPHCGKNNPAVQALQIGESADALMVAFVPVDCCKKIISCMLIQKLPPGIPAVN